MKTNDFATCNLDELSTVTGGAQKEPYQTDANGVVLPGDRNPSGTINKGNPLIQFGKPDHQTPLPTPYLDGRPPFLHFN